MDNTQAQSKAIHAAYGHTFQDERAKNAYAQMQSEKRARAKARKSAMSPQEISDSQTRAHFAKEAKHFGM